MTDEVNTEVIDPGRLDRELQQQPGRTRRAGHAEADARHAYTQAKSRLEVVEANLRLAVRRNPEKFGFTEKVTIPDLEALVRVQKDYIDALEAVNVAKYALDILSADVTAELDRRKCIERLVDLLQLDYHSEFIPVPTTEAGREYMKAANNRGCRQDIDSVDFKDK